MDANTINAVVEISRGLAPNVTEALAGAAATFIVAALYRVKLRIGGDARNSAIRIFAAMAAVASTISLKLADGTLQGIDIQSQLAVLISAALSWAIAHVAHKAQKRGENLARNS